MTSHDLKAAMLTHMLYRLHYVGVVTEYGGKGVVGIADVFGVTDSGMTHEFETKVSKTDLAGEIEAIKHLAKLQLGLEELPGKPVAKAPKHSLYLNGPRNEYYSHLELRPNRFSFVVPEGLEEYAKQGLKDTPYGLYVVQERWHDPVCKIKARWLHKEKASNLLILNLLGKASSEVEVLRRKAAKGRLCTRCEKELPGRCESCEEALKKERKYNKDSNFCFAEMDRLDLPHGPERSQAFKACMEQRQTV